MKNAICLITIEPNKVWLDFLATFTQYDVYILVDNLEFDYAIYMNAYPTLNIIKITNEECAHYGYIHSSYMPNSSLKFNQIIAWDRALCYFTNKNTIYKNIWFFEDDVFFYNENTILQIDSAYLESDILCKDKNPEPKQGEWNWFWPAITIHFSGPYFHSPIAAVRMSAKLLGLINEYVQVNKKLCFIEALFPSIAHYKNLLYDSPIELNQIHWRQDWQSENMTKSQVFHPIKNMLEQKEKRDYLTKDV